MDFKTELDKAYSDSIDFLSDGDIVGDVISKNSFVCNHIFQLTLYDDGHIADRFIEAYTPVIRYIIDRKNFEYIKIDYYNYLTVVNHLNNLDWLEWGGSIRGCWFIREDIYLESIDIHLTKDQIVPFFDYLLTWLKIK